MYKFVVDLMDIEIHSVHLSFANFFIYQNKKDLSSPKDARLRFEMNHEIFLLTRPDTRLPQSRAGGQGQCWRRSLEHLGRISKLKKLINAEEVTGRPRAICGQRYPLPCFICW